MNARERTLKVLKECLAVFDSEEHKGIFVIAHLRGMPYKGPTVDREEIRKLISELEKEEEEEEEGKCA